MKYSSTISEYNDSTQGGILSALKDRGKEYTGFHQGMTPEEVADVISDQLMTTIKAQMAEGKRRYEEGQQGLK